MEANAEENNVPLDPQVASFLQQLVDLDAPALRDIPIAESRVPNEISLALAGDVVPVGSAVDVTIAVDGGHIDARVYTPASPGPHPVVVFFHGGGWVICSIDTHDNLARALCRDANALVVSVGYRMAPEFAFPIAPQDCYAATCWVADNAASFGGDSSRLAVCGDSAGGNLSAVVSQMARDSGGPHISFAALIYPAVDMTADGGSLVDNGTGCFLERADMEWFMNHYLAPDERGDVRASPLLNPDLADLPPCFITTCEFDILRDEGEAYGAALRASGVEAETKRYDGLIHAVAGMPAAVDGGRQMVADVTDRLRQALHRAPRHQVPTR